MKICVYLVFFFFVFAFPSVFLYECAILFRSLLVFFFFSFLLHFFTLLFHTFLPLFLFCGLQGSDTDCKKLTQRQAKAYTDGIYFIETYLIQVLIQICNIYVFLAFFSRTIYCDLSTCHCIWIPLPFLRGGEEGYV